MVISEFRPTIMRSRPRITERRPLTEATLARARFLMGSGMSIRQAAKEIGFTEGALRRRLKKGHGAKQLGRFRRTFSIEQEQSIFKHCVALDRRFFGLTLKSLRHLLFNFAEKNNIPHRFSTETKLAGRDFTRDFMKRNKLSLRIPRKTSVARMMGFNKNQLNNYFDNLESVMKKYGFPPNCIYNMDETGVQTVPNILPKHVAPTGKREVAKSVSAEQGQTVTVACSMNAVGHYIPPFFIFARKRLNLLLIKGGPTGCDMSVTDKGYMTIPVFIQYLEHFSKFTNPSAENPILLILDNHVSHIGIEAVTYAKSHHIHMLSLPPHSSHKTQPLDRNFFRPMKAYYNSAADSWNVSHPGQVLSVYNVAELVKIAFEKAATVENAVQGFQVTGIFPLDRNVFSEADFAPSEVTDQNVEEEDQNDDNQKLVFDCERNEIRTEQEADGPELDISASTSFNLNTIVSDADILAPPPEPTLNLINQESPENSNTDEPVPSCSYFNSTCSQIVPEDIIPLPKIKIKRKRNKKGMKSVLLTSTPNKELLETSLGEKQKKANDTKKKIVKKTKGTLLPSRPNKTKKKLASSSSSESDTDVTFRNSSDFDMPFTEFEQNDEEDVDDTPLFQEGDFVVVKIKGKTKDSFRCHIIKIISSHDEGYRGIFYTRVPNTHRFQETKEEAYVQNEDIILKLYKPTHNSTVRFQNTVSFLEDLSDFNV